MSRGRETRNAGRVIKQIIAGGGPNGEDLERTIDRETERVLQEIVLQDYDTTGSNSGSALEATAPIVAAAPAALISASEMLRLALREREATFGKLVHELLEEIMTGCKSVILDGVYNHSIPLMQGISSEVVKQAVRELKGLGYKVKVVPDPGSLATLTVKWPVKEDKAAKKLKKASRVVKEPVQEVATPPTEDAAPKASAPVPKESKSGDVPEVIFKKEKVMPGGRPPRPKPRRAEI